ncbi:hypothetical protein Pla8534_40180 [Lignipirellula cremea]|uniref:DNA polymerase IV n=2 Tax=Lignipirellula cremea TaxID=2528010 RepID=A0A518DWI9_9BACT|nr:hypothetical protein Pla8534_40180 [Lignipirellula cremea]
MPLSEATALLQKQEEKPGKKQPEQTPSKQTPSTNGSDALPGEPAAGFHLEPHNPAADAAALLRLAERCERFSPVVGVERVDPAGDTLLLDVSGLGRIFGGEAELVALVERTLRDWGYTPRLAVADTPGAAWAVAHFGRQPHTVVPAAGTAAALAPLSPAALRLPETATAMLRRLGMERIEQVLALPRVSLATRFTGDAPLLLRLDQALGAAAEMIVPHHAAEPAAVTWDFEYASTNRRAIAAVFEKLLQRLTGPLALRQEGVVCLRCRLTCEEQPPLCFDLGLYQPSASAPHLLDLLQPKLERLRLPAPVEAIAIEAAAIAPLEIRQRELFADDYQSRRRLALLIERLSSRLGREAVGRLECVSDAQPEEAYRFVPLTGTAAEKTTGAKKTSASGPSHGPAPAADGPIVRLPPLARPLRLLDPPAAIRVTALANGPPVRFDYQGRQYRAADSLGPERIETGWWRGPSVRRDYYWVTCETGQRFWLFRRLTDGCWFLHGEFA